MSKRLRNNSPTSAARLRGALIVHFALASGGCNADQATAPRQAAPVPSRDEIKSANWGQRGRIVSAQLVRTIDRTATAAVITQNSGNAAFEARYDVEQWSVRYTTIDTHGDLAVVGAGIFLPVGAGEALPMVSFSKATTTVKTGGPSSLTTQNPQGVMNATHGSITVVADYLGLGADGGHFHPFLDADVGATTSLDALRAARELVEQNGLSLDGRLFIYGYSQGGQIAMALTRLIQDDPRSRFRVTASAPMSGPYALYEGVQNMFANPQSYLQNSISIAYLVASFQEIYHLAPSLDALLIPPFDTVGRHLVDLGMTLTQLQASLPLVARSIVQPDVVNQVLTDPEAPLSRALRANDTYDWRPEMPMRLYYATADLDVWPQNTIIAEARMNELGAPDVEAVNLGPLTHGAAQPFAVVAARRWFDSFPAPAVVPDDDSGDDDQVPAATALVRTPDWQ
jgi:hypothetical protein